MTYVANYAKAAVDSAIIVGLMIADFTRPRKQTKGLGMGMPKFAKYGPYAIIVVPLFVFAVSNLAIIGKIPEYDLLFSIDQNDSYDDSQTKGIIIRVVDRRAEVIFSGRWWDDLRLTRIVPTVLVCSATTGAVRKIDLNIDPGKLQPGLKQLRIPVSYLNNLTVDPSTIAPNGYQFIGIDFLKAYPWTDFNSNIALSLGSLTNLLVNSNLWLKKDSYGRCLEHDGNNFAGITVHFIGWIIPKSAN